MKSSTLLLLAVAGVGGYLYAKKKANAQSVARIAGGTPAPVTSQADAPAITNNYYYDAPPDWGWDSGPVFWMGGGGGGRRRGGGGHGHHGGGHHGGHH